jgi:hypothetical protein
MIPLFLVASELGSPLLLVIHWNQGCDPRRPARASLAFVLVIRSSVLFLRRATRNDSHENPNLAFLTGDFLGPMSFCILLTIILAATTPQKEKTLILDN